MWELLSNCVSFRLYEDFTTIDWIQDSILERNRRIRHANSVYASSRGPSGEINLPWLWAQFRKVVEAGQTWFVVSLVGEHMDMPLLPNVLISCIMFPNAGICIGLNAAIISIMTEWLSDIKMGYCSDGWWLNQQFCCWEIEGDKTDVCESWHPWSNVTIARWLIYVIFAVRICALCAIHLDSLVLVQGIFSFVAGHLVRSLAKYAAGSGISEIKCILAGFVMKGFLGFATFAIKSITLVSISFLIDCYIVMTVVSL